MGQPKIQMYSMIVQATLNILLSFVLIRLFGFFGAVVGTASSAIFGGLLFFRWYGKQLTPRPFSMLVQIVSKPLLSVAPAVIMSLAVASFIRPAGIADSRWSALLLVAVGSATLLICYAVMLIVSKSLTSDDKGFFVKVVPARVARLLG
jgi:Na+-driven multidrug efflux pump